MSLLGLSKEKPPDYLPPSQGPAAPILSQPLPYGYPPSHIPPLMPSPSDWMAPPPPPSYGMLDCPPGLEYLATVDALLVQQKVELLETLTGFESNNKYTVKNTLGQKAFVAIEDSNWLNRMGGPMRPFQMKIINNFGVEVIHLDRPLACHGCVCPFWLQRLAVFSPPGSKIGSVQQEWTMLRPQYAVLNSAGETVLRIKGPACRFTFAVEFSVRSVEGDAEVGKITRHWSGLAREVFTDAAHFGISFPPALDVRLKAVLLGACFLIDFMFFED